MDVLKVLLLMYFAVGSYVILATLGNIKDKWETPISTVLYGLFLILCWPWSLISSYLAYRKFEKTNEDITIIDVEDMTPIESIENAVIAYEEEDLAKCEKLLENALELVRMEQGK
jgi:hypothetical protein